MNKSVRRSRVSAVGTAAAVLAALLVVPALVAGGSDSAQAAPYTGPQRIAFTDDRDRLDRVTITAPSDDDDDYAATYPESVTTAAGEHEGEATAGFYATPYVTTQSDVSGAISDPDGEVYLRPRQGLPTGFDAKAVTCDNTDQETHPVLFVDEPTETYGGTYTFYVAYASDALTGSGDADRDWNIWVATQSVEYTPDSSSGIDPGPAALLSGACGSWDYTLVTADDPPGGDVDQLWPAYLPSGRGLVYSRTSPADPLGDLYLHMFNDEGPPTITQLTSDGVGSKERADTQPSVEIMYRGNQQAEWWVAFTTTRFYSVGSVALLCICNPQDPEPEEPIDPLSRPGTSEASWSASDGTNALAFTTTDVDPYGDIDVALFDPPTFGDPPSEPPDPPSVRRTINVSNQPGIAETHASFERPFDRSEESATLAFTSRSTSADISDVVAADGSDRRTRIANAFLNTNNDRLVPEDEAWPDYNGDASKITYSREVHSIDGEDDGRQVMVANSDGTDPVPVVAGRDIYDFDIDPVFSPTRNQIALTRYRYDDSYASPVIVIADLATGAFREVETGTRTADLDPDWSPDGNRIVFARADRGWSPYGDSNRRPGTPNSIAFRSFLYVVPAAGGTPRPVVANENICGDCSDDRIHGRQPTWAPDGKHLVYTELDSLRSVNLLGTDIDGGLGSTVPAAITGFDASDAAMPSRGQISAAEDPAWSPDGSEIAFAGQPAGQPDNRGIYAIKPDGSGLRLVTDDRGPDTEPTWTPVTKVVPTPQADVAVALEFANPALDALGLDPEVSYVGNTTHVVLVDVTNRSETTTAASVTLALTFPPTTPSPAPDPPRPVYASDSPQPCLTGVGTCLLGSIAPGDTRTFEIPLLIRKEGDADVGAKVTSTTADPVTTNNTATATLEVLQPTIRLLPAVARPGRVTMAYGEKMPPGSAVMLGWTPGLNIHRGPFDVDTDGTMRQPLLIVRHDLLGDRELELTSGDPEAPAVPPLFTAVQGPMLVIERTAQAPDFLARG